MEIGSSNRAPVAQEDWIRILDHHPAIIPRELFNTVQERLLVKGEPHRKRKLTTANRYAASSTSPLSGRVVCGHCGYAMRISTTKNATFHCRFTLHASDAKCHRLRVPKSELEREVLGCIVRQAKAVEASGRLPPSNHRMLSPAESEYEGRIEEMEEEKQRLYETFVLGSICKNEYKAKKVIADSELERARQVLQAIQGHTKQRVSDAVTMNAAREVLQKRILTQEIVDLLIDRVLVHPDRKIEVVWKLSGFVDSMPQEAIAHVAI